MKKLMSIALEAESSTGKTKKELEYVFYARLIDFGFLEQATHKELHDQWEIKINRTEENASSGRMRVRKTTENGEVTYVMTTKTLDPTNTTELRKELETANPSSEDAFNQFKLMAPCGMVKERYTFPLANTDLKLEVDITILPDGNKSEWCRIELEVDEPLETLPQLPDAFTDVIYNQYKQRTPEEEAKVRELYDTVFLRKNEFLK